VREAQLARVASGGGGSPYYSMALPVNACRGLLWPLLRECRRAPFSPRESIFCRPAKPIEQNGWAPAPYYYKGLGRSLGFIIVEVGRPYTIMGGQPAIIVVAHF
jgi:hypothetical protein